MRNRYAALVAVFTLVAGGLGALGVSLPATAAAPTPAGGGHFYEREWIYSTSASETPDAMAVDRAGRVYVVARRAGSQPGSRLRVYDGAGRLLWTWNDLIDVDHVGGMTVDADGNIRLTNYSGTPGIHVYSPRGALLRSYGLPEGSGHWTAGGIAVAGNGTSYVTDPVNGAIHRFAPNGAYQTSFGGEGTAPGRYDAPWDVDLAPDGNLVVADTANYRVQVIRSSNGAPIRQWGQSGVSNGQFSGGVTTVEVHGNQVLVSDWTSRIQVFTLAGRYVTTISPVTKRSNRLVDSIGDLEVGPGKVLHVAGRLYPFENGVARYQPARASVARTGKVLKANKKRKRAAIKVTCRAGNQPCRGRLVIRKGKKKLGQGRLKVAATSQGKVKVKLNKRARTLLRKKRKVNVKLQAKLVGSKSFTRKVRLTR